MLGLEDPEDRLGKDAELSFEARERSRELTEMQTTLRGSQVVTAMKQALEELRIEVAVPDAVAALGGVIRVAVRGMEPLEQVVMKAES